MTGLKALKPGDKARLVAFGDTQRDYRQRLLCMGITRGTEILVKRIAPLGCPVQIVVRDTSLSLRLDETEALVWERV